MDLNSIIMGAGMSCRPAYYSGRGATTTDLNRDVLESIYKGIHIRYGKQAAQAYVDMVSNIKVLSATTFLTELFMLHGNDWKSSVGNREDSSGTVIDKDENGNYDMGSGMMGLLSSLTRDTKDETHQIRYRFLVSHGVRMNSHTDEYGNRLAYYGKSFKQK